MWVGVWVGKCGWGCVGVCGWGCGWVSVGVGGDVLEQRQLSHSSLKHRFQGIFMILRYVVYKTLKSSFQSSPPSQPFIPVPPLKNFFRVFSPV